MDVLPSPTPLFHLVWHRTLRQVSDQVRRLAAEVQPPVHVFDIRPQVLRGLYSVALVTRSGDLHRCVVPYRDLRAPAGLERILCRGELEHVDGRIELGVNTGELLRYFLPNLEGAAGGMAGALEERCRRVWWAAAVAGEGQVAVRRLRFEESGSVVGCISRGGVHWLLRLSGQGQWLEAAATRLGCAEVEAVDVDSALYRDVMGEWQS